MNKYGIVRLLLFLKENSTIKQKLIIGQLENIG